MSKEPEETPEMEGNTEKEVENENKEDVKEPEVVEQKAAEAEKVEEPRYFKLKIVIFKLKIMILNSEIAFTVKNWSKLSFLREKSLFS
ncbi:hypothetical protein CRE_26758 [Caenorhabditis remanei]|uniref:Uncharacterized protein n=1 Tax=Caenorhabditis remanei TaxID=31234 RepID=E3MXW2_CAERE|nr:hypothetical protein CRE_26758 [Caenorhabditis remanei]